MAGLVPAIHVFAGREGKTWMPGTRPGMTSLEMVDSCETAVMVERRARSRNDLSPCHRRAFLRLRGLARSAGQGDAATLRRPAGRLGGRNRGTDDRGTDGA